MHNLVIMFWNWNVICFWVVTLDLYMCLPKNIKSNVLQGCHLDACESCANENWSHIRYLKCTLNWISNVSQYTLILVIGVKPHCLIPSLFICYKFETPIIHRGWGVRWTFWNFVFTLVPFRLDGWTMYLWICNYLWNVENLLIACAFKNIQGLATMGA